MQTKNTNSQTLHTLPDDLAKILAGNAKIEVLWNKLTPLARNEWICWVTIVKQKKTRNEHLVRLQEDLQKGKKRPCCWPGCQHRRPSTA
jgi:uncharacterized protein YdeI (YjbR/CyaY-like superfamily)